MGLETQIQTAIIYLLDIYERQGKLFFNRMNNIPTPIKDRVTGKTVGYRKLSTGAKKGIPDIWVIKDGKTIGLEVKAPKGTQRKEQKDIEERFKTNGAEYHIVRSVDEVKKIFQSFSVGNDCVFSNVESCRGN